MKFTKHQIVTLATGGLAVLAVILTLINPGAQQHADKLNELSQKIVTLNMAPDEDRASDESSDLTLFWFNAGEACSIIDNTSNGKRYGVAPGKIIGGEVNSLRLRDSGVDYEFGNLPSGLSYTGIINSKMGRPEVVYCKSRYASDGFDVLVYDSRLPMSDLDHRFPLYRKFFMTSQIIPRD